MSEKAKIKVLMVDKSRFSCLAVRRILSGYPEIDFTFAADVESAIRAADDYLPTVMLYSVGQEAKACRDDIDALKRNPSTQDVPTILLSDLEGDALQECEAKLGGAELVSKLEDAERLVKKIHQSGKEYLDALRKEIPERTYSTKEAGPARVLLIDDSKTVCLGFGKIIADRTDIVFEYCIDSTLALDAVKRFNPTVILLDLEMPKLSGFELLPMLRAEPTVRDVPIIVLSGTTDPKVKANAFELGANDYAEKNMDRVELFGRIRYHTTAYKNEKELDRSINQLLEVKKRLEIQRNFIRRTFGRYLSDEIVANILETPEGLELGGAKQVISIMMTDLRGFTSLGERLDPEKVLAIINNYLSVMTEILAKYHGTVDEFIGDAILAMFGAPVRHEEYALNAVACAVEMQLAMTRVNEWNRSQGLPDVSMGIGINTGDVIVGNIGSERRAKYGIVGRNVNLTSRIESCTVGGQILISESTFEACGGLLRIDGRSEVMPKGVERPITIYEVGGIGGRFDLYLPERAKREIPRMKRPLGVRFYVLEGKLAGQELKSGEVAGLLGSEALLDTDVKLVKFQDLKVILTDLDGVELTSELYGKVLEEASEGAPARVHFTSIPEEAAAFFRNVV